MADNWEWRSQEQTAPSWYYPQNLKDDAYVSWDDPGALVLALTTEEIDAFDVAGHGDSTPQTLTLESEEVGGNTLSCGHISFKAGPGPLSVTVADQASLLTVD